MDYTLYTMKNHLGERHAPWMYRFSTPEKVCKNINDEIKDIENEDTYCEIEERYNEYGNKDTYISFTVPGSMENPYGTNVNILCPDKKDKACVLMGTVESMIREEIAKEMEEVKEREKRLPDKLKKEYIKRLWKINRALL